LESPGLARIRILSLSLALSFALALALQLGVLRAAGRTAVFAAASAAVRFGAARGV